MMPKIKDLPKVDRPRKKVYYKRIIEKNGEKMNRRCAVCGKDISVVLFPDKTYEGGHYFFKLPDKKEYWECDECYHKE